ncbi:hypothetical protein RN607_08305 [Demequina capsici]|uniref:Cysteine-rich secretory protein family protein n=1 Tax=Demequina capsici TaxID=3075620 RepID=A0AA96FCU7_9MICO|nr:hypothetical protein [Demequina sp. PMTSA13]WNM26201.1 hypothetical protein RN607_08305 [Demequina sp. PMTSA13]
MTMPRRRVLASVGVLALVILLAIGLVLGARHRDAIAWRESVQALTDAVAACESAQSSMVIALDAGQARLAREGLPPDAAEVAGLAALVDDAAALADECTAAPAHTAAANEAVAASLEDAGSRMRDLGLRLAEARASVDAAQAAYELDAARSAFQQAVVEAQSAVRDAQGLLQSSQGEVADDAALSALSDAISAVGSAAGPPPADADAAWFASRQGVLAKALQTLADASTQVESSRQAWSAAQATAPRAGGGSGSSSSSTTAPGGWSDFDVSVADPSAFCAALDSARTGAGSPALTSCVASDAQSAHAIEMAQAGSIWHTGNENIVGYSDTVSSLMAAFMASSTHRALILTDGRQATAQVGCAWRHDWGANAQGATYDYSQIYCSARFDS